MTARWNFEAIAARQVVHSTNFEASEWLDQTAQEIEAQGLPHRTARYWLVEFLNQFDVRVDADLGRNLSLLRFAARAQQFLLPGAWRGHDLQEAADLSPDDAERIATETNRHDLERVAKFASWATVRVLAALCPEVAAEWTAAEPQDDSEEPDSRTSGAWALFACCQAMPALQPAWRLTEALWSEASRCVDRAGFAKAAVILGYREWWSQTGGLPPDAGWVALRDICADLKRRADDVIDQDAEAWGEEWRRLAGSEPRSHVARQSSFRNRRGDASLLEAATGLRDLPRSRRLFAWQLQKIFDETVASATTHSNRLTPEVLAPQICDRFPGRINLTEAVVLEFLKTHGLLQSGRLPLQAHLLNCASLDVRRLARPERDWSLQRILLVLLKESMARGMPLSKEFYDGLQRLLASALARTSLRALVAVPNAVFADQLELALQLLGIDRSRASPHGVAEWRQWNLSRGSTIQPPLYALIAESITAYPAGSAPSRTQRNAVVPEQPLREVSAAARVVEVVSVDDALAGITDSLSDLATSVQRVQEQLQGVRSLWSQGDEERLEELQNSARAWKLEYDNLKTQVETVRESAISDFLREWNGGDSLNSTLNRLYRWSQAEEQPDLCGAAREFLMRLNFVGVHCRRANELHQIVQLPPEAKETWNFMPGHGPEEYGGQGFLLTPEWRYRDVVLESPWVDPPMVHESGS